MTSKGAIARSDSKGTKSKRQGRRMNRTGEGIVRAGYENKKDQGIARAGHGNEINF